MYITLLMCVYLTDNIWKYVLTSSEKEMTHPSGCDGVGVAPSNTPKQSHVGPSVASPNPSSSPLRSRLPLLGSPPSLARYSFLSLLRKRMAPRPPGRGQLQNQRCLVAAPLTCAPASNLSTDPASSILFPQPTPRRRRHRCVELPPGIRGRGVFLEEINTYKKHNALAPKAPITRPPTVPPSANGSNEMQSLPPRRAARAQEVKLWKVGVAEQHIGAPAR